MIDDIIIDFSLMWHINLYISKNDMFSKIEDVNILMYKRYIQ